MFFILLSGARALNLEDQVIEHTLDNGLRILMVERSEVPRVVCHIYYRVGSIFERPGITGISHFHEHMMFKGTRMMGVSDFEADHRLNVKIDSLMDLVYNEKYHKKNGDMDAVRIWQQQAESLMKEEKQYIIKDDLWETYMRNGGTGLNASTGKESTGYYVTLPANKVELQMLLESDRMANAYFREFYSEKEVVREERRLSENRPGYLFQEQLNATFYAASPYSWGVIGWDIDLQTMTKQDMIDFNRQYYVPNNAVAVYVGDIDPQKIIRMAEKYFGSIPRGPEPEPIRTLEPPQHCEKRLYGEAPTMPSMTILYHIPPAGHPDEAVFDVITGLLNGRTGRLYKSLVLEKDLATRAQGYGMVSAYSGAFNFGALPKTQGEVTMEDLERALVEEIDRLKNEPVEERELQKVKNQTEARFIRGLRSDYGLAARLGRAELYQGWRDLDRSSERLNAVTADDIMRVASTYFVKDNRTVGILLRKETGSRGPGQAGRGSSR